MRMTTEELKSGWLHPRRVVRNAVAHRFSHSFTADPDVTDQAICSVREFGWRKCLTWPHDFASLPLANDAAFEWVCGEVERTDEAAPSHNLKWHLTVMLSLADIDIVERHRSRLLTLSALRPRERDAVLTRLDLATCPPAEVWRRLEQHCRMAAAGETFEDARIPEAELLLEPLARDGGASVAKVMEVLSQPAADGDGPADWLTGLMITLAGRLRVEDTAPLLWKLSAIDWDWYRGEAIEALKRIGTPAVAQLAREAYEQADWIGRLHAASIYSDLHTDETAAAITEALALEHDDNLRSYLGQAAAGHFDDRLVPVALSVMHEDFADPERAEIRERLVAFSHLSGYELPDRDAWEREADDLDRLASRVGDRPTGSLARLLLQVMAGDEDALDNRSFDAGGWGDAEPLVSRGAHTGRNAPCPCGSGKKYKRCCLPGGAA